MLILSQMSQMSQMSHLSTEFVSNVVNVVNVANVSNVAIVYSMEIKTKIYMRKKALPPFVLEGNAGSYF